MSTEFPLHYELIITRETRDQIVEIFKDRDMYLYSARYDVHVAFIYDQVIVRKFYDIVPTEKGDVIMFGLSVCSGTMSKGEIFDRVKIMFGVAPDIRFVLKGVPDYVKYAIEE